MNSTPEVKRLRILVALLIASWTLNVALGMALYMRSHYPIGAFFPGIFSKSRFDRPRFEDRFPGGRERFREEIGPFIECRRDLMISLSNEFAQDTLDTVRIHALSDSLDRLMLGVKGKALEHLIQMHAVMPPLERRQVLPRMLRHFGMDPGCEVRRFDGPPCGDPPPDSLSRGFERRHREKHFDR